MPSDHRNGDDHEIAGLHGANVVADGFDHADEFVAHAAAGVARAPSALYGHRSLPQMRGAGDADERVCRLDQMSVGNVFDSNVAGAVHDGCAHGVIETAYATDRG